MYNVLIADDDKLMRTALKVMICKIDGFDVKFSVGCGEEAVEICKNNKIDIVFMDIMMNGESGIDSSKKIYENNPNTTIFILSAYSSFEFAIEALKTKVKYYLSKPLSFNELKSLLDEYSKENNKSSCDYSSEIEKLNEIIEENDFKRVYYEVQNITKDIYLSCTDKQTLKDTFNSIGQTLIDIVDVIHQDKTNIDDIFPMNQVFITQEKYLEFWIFNIMDYVFKKKSIKKYPLLESVFYYIDEHIKDEIGLNEIINNCNVSQGYLSRILKKQFKVSVMEYLHMRKINLAKNYFTFTSLSITDIAFKLGYNESSYFSKVFKKYENITVYQYKKMI